MKARRKIRKKTRMLASACVAAPTLLGLPSAVQANLLPGEIVNGDFELPPLSGFGAYSGTAPGWQLVGGALVQTESVPPFENGVAAMNNGFTAAVRQDTGHVMSLGEVFALKADAFTRSDSTQVSFELFAVDGGTFAASPFASAILDNSDDHADNMWTREFPFGGTAGAAEAGLTLGIQFRNSSGPGQDNNGGQVLIDNVVIPEPASQTLVGMAAATFSTLFGFLRRRSRKDATK